MILRARRSKSAGRRCFGGYFSHLCDTIRTIRQIDHVFPSYVNQECEILISPFRSVKSRFDTPVFMLRVCLI